MSAFKGEYPENLSVRGQMSFPLYNAKQIEEAKEWRAKKGFKKTKYAEKIGGTLLLKPIQFERVRTNLLDVVLPFTTLLYKETDGDKGVAPDVVKALAEQIKKGNWIGPDGKPNLPLRDLSAKDKEATGGDSSPYVGKIKFQGPWADGAPAPLEVSALLVNPENNSQKVVSIQELIDDEVIPESRRDITKLWWGAGWDFKIAARFSAYDAASIGISTYVNKAYLLPHLGLPVLGGGGADAAIEQDGDDWSDEE